MACKSCCHFRITHLAVKSFPWHDSRVKRLRQYVSEIQPKVFSEGLCNACCSEILGDVLSCVHMSKIQTEKVNNSLANNHFWA